MTTDEVTQAILTLLNETQIAQLEEAVEMDPSDLTSRIRLLGTYMRTQFTSNAAKAARLKHIKWIIENCPDHAVAESPIVQVFNHDQAAYEQCKDAWLEQLQSRKGDIAVLANAANFFLLRDKEIAEKCLLDARELEPQNVRWSRDLAHLYDLCGNERATDALQENERLLQLVTNAEDNFYALTPLPQRAFEAGDLDKATTAANRLLELAEEFRDDWNYGNAVQTAHTTLGRIALRNQEMDKAKKHLLQSAGDADSPQTSTFGPEMKLAYELIEAGESQSVIEYLDECKKFCGAMHEHLINARVRIEYGQVTDTSPEAQIHFAINCQRVQLQQLELEPIETKRDCLLFIIEDTERFIAICKTMVHAGSDDPIVESRLKQSTEHLARLKALLAELSSEA